VVGLELEMSTALRSVWTFS